MERFPAWGFTGPPRQRDLVDLGDFVQAHEQRGVEAPGWRRLPDLRGLVVDLGRHRGEQRRDRSVLADLLGDHVQRPAPGQEPGDVEPRPGGGSTLAASIGSAMNDRARDMTIRTVATVLRVGRHLGESHGPLAGPDQDLLSPAGSGATHPATARRSSPASAAAWEIGPPAASTSAT